MKYLRKYLKIAPFSHAVWRATEVQSLEKVKLVRPILDLGCGFGEFAGVFYQSTVEVGIDVSISDLEKAALVKKYKKLRLADARDLPFDDESFRTVVSLSVIEHILDTKKVLSEVRRILKKDGKFIFTTPEKTFTKLLFYPRLFRLLKLDYLAKKYENGINKVFKHYSLYSREEWEELLKTRGFEVEKIEPNIGENVAMIWDIGLLFAFPSQLYKILFGKRLVIAPDIKIKILEKIFQPMTEKVKGRVCNFLIVARKI